MRIRLYWVPLLLAVLIGAFCSVGGVDDVSIWVLEFANGVQWTKIHQPAPLPPPMQDFVFRPISLFFMKITLIISGGDLDVPQWMVGLKSFLFLAVFGVGSWLWLRQWSSEFWATVLTLVAMVCEPSLFSSFNYSEFDGLGAGLILLSSWLLANHSARWIWFAFISVGIVFLKESSCCIWICFLVPQLFLHWKDPNFCRENLKRVCMVIGAVLLLWLMGMNTVLLGKVSSSAGGIGMEQRLPIVQFTMWQITSLWMEGGVFLLLVGSLNKRKTVVFIICLITAVAVPMMAFNHYETRYFSRPVYMTILSFVWLLVCLWHVKRSQSNYPLFMTAGSCVSLLGLFLVVILTSSNLREDLASRLFLCLVPGMMLVCLQMAKHLWAEKQNRWMVCILISSQLWGLTIGAWNWGQKIWFENANHEPWTMQLVEKLTNESDFSDSNQTISVVVTDTSRRYSTRRLQSLVPNQSTKQIDRLQFEPLCYFLSIPNEQWTDALIMGLSQDAHLSKKDTYVLHRGHRLEEVFTPYFQRDFSWIRSPDRGAHMSINSGDSRCTERSLIEDRYDYSFSSTDPMASYLNSGLKSVQLLEVRYYQLTSRMFNVPHMFFAEIPLWQTWQFHQSLYKVHL